MYTALSADNLKVSYTDLCDTEHGPAVEPRTYVTITWGRAYQDDFIATSYPGHLDRSVAIARAVEEMNALDDEIAPRSRANDAEGRYVG